MSKRRIYSSDRIVRTRYNYLILKRCLSLKCRWKAYDETNNTAIIYYDNVQAKINLDQIDQIIPQKGEVVQCIGEVMEVKLFKLHFSRYCFNFFFHVGVR